MKTEEVTEYSRTIVYNNHESWSGTQLSWQIMLEQGKSSMGVWISKVCNASLKNCSTSYKISTQNNESCLLLNFKHVITHCSHSLPTFFSCVPCPSPSSCWSSSPLFSPIFHPLSLPPLSPEDHFHASQFLFYFTHKHTYIYTRQIHRHMDTYTHIQRQTIQGGHRKAKIPSMYLHTWPQLCSTL